MIAIIGTGNMGSGLGRRWAAAGYPVVFGSRTPHEKQALARYLGPNVEVAGVAEAVQAAGTVLLAVPWAAVPHALAAAGPLDGKVLIDCTNPTTPDYMRLLVGHSTSGAEQIAARAPGARVVKSFNHIYAHILHTSPQFGARRASAFYCGDDADARAAVARLIEAAGLEPIDAGPLHNARYLEPLAELAMQLAYALGRGTDETFGWLTR